MSKTQRVAAGVPGRNYRSASWHLRRCEVGEEVKIKFGTVFEPGPRRRAEAGPIARVQANPDATRLDASGRISSRLETVLNAGSSKTGAPDPSTS